MFNKFLVFVKSLLDIQEDNLLGLPCVYNGSVHPVLYNPCKEGTVDRIYDKLDSVSDNETICFLAYIKESIVISEDDYNGDGFFNIKHDDISAFLDVSSKIIYHWLNPEDDISKSDLTLIKYIKDISPVSTYLRFGEIPEDGLSKIYAPNPDGSEGCIEVGKCPGVCCYDTVYMNERYHIILPIPYIKEYTCNDIHGYLLGNVTGVFGNSDCYVVKGNKVGVGPTGEPCVNIIGKIGAQNFKYSGKEE